MKTGVGIALCMACYLTTAAAQWTFGQEKEIRDLETKRFHAMEKADVVTLEGILSDDLIYTHADGKSQSKFDVLATVGSSEMRYESITPYDARVRIYREMAVVTGRASIKIRAHGQQESFDICYLDVYAKQDGRWQMVAWQSSRLPA